MYTHSKQQFNEMKFALKMFGVLNEYDNNVIDYTVAEDDVVNALLMCYQDNEYEFAKHEFDTEIESMYEFLIDLNNQEYNGVCENFEVTKETMGFDHPF